MEEETAQECNMSRSEAHHASKKRKMDDRVVVTVKMQESDKKQQKSEGPPSDCWSWRKYGQKPIKGSPHPRGYYRCSTSKGCSAKKQLERCKTDSSMLIITYTSTHNHPGPVLSPISLKLEDEKQDNSAPSTPKQDQDTEEEPPQEEPPAGNNTEDQFHYFNCSSQDDILINQEEGNLFSEDIDQTPGVLYNERVLQQPFSDDPVKNRSPVSKSEENDFFDELEELPTSSFFMAFMRNSFCEERIPVNPA